jgi:hypothetical protein
MKSIKDIEKMTLEELEAVSMDEGIVVPEGFRESMEARMKSHEAGRKSLRIISIAAAASLLVGAGFGLAGLNDQPKDTFDDPYLAYAQVEKALSMMSEGMKKGFDMADESEAIIIRTTEILK